MSAFYFIFKRGTYLDDSLLEGKVRVVDLGREALPAPLLDELPRKLPEVAHLFVPDLEEVLAALGDALEVFVGLREVTFDVTKV